jgi:hypothetical protein
MRRNSHWYSNRSRNHSSISLDLSSHSTSLRQSIRGMAMSLPNRTGRDSTPVHHRHSSISFGSAELDLVYVDKSHNFIANVENLTGHWDLSHPQEPPSRPHIRRFRFSRIRHRHQVKFDGALGLATCKTSSSSLGNDVVERDGFKQTTVAMPGAATEGQLSSSSSSLVYCQPEKSMQITTSRPFSLLLRFFFASDELSRLLTRLGDVFSSSSDERRSITSLMLVGRRHHRNAKTRVGESCNSILIHTVVLVGSHSRIVP